MTIAKGTTIKRTSKAIFKDLGMADGRGERWSHLSDTKGENWWAQ
jgi:hypothetical protein